MNAAPRRLVVVVVVCAGFAAHGQTSRPSFEVASVKRNQSGLGSSGENTRLGVFVATNEPFVRFVQFGYDVYGAQVIGGPDWVRDYRFDINAKADGDAPVDQLRLMMQSLLEDRFKLRVRREQREMSFFELRLARGDGRVGPNLHDCSNVNDKAGTSSPDKSFTAPPGGSVSAGSCSTLARIAAMASRQMQAVVVDKTGLTGNWRYDIYYGPDLPQPGSNPDLPSFVSAMQEQLGLRLERTKGPVDVLVIESAQQPTED